MRKSAISRTLKNSQNATGTRLLCFLAFGRKMWNRLISQNSIRMCSLDNVFMLKTFLQSDLRYAAPLQRYGPDLIFGSFFQSVLSCVVWSHNYSKSVLMGQFYCKESSNEEISIFQNIEKFSKCHRYAPVVLFGLRAENVESAYFSEFHRNVFLG